MRYADAGVNIAAANEVKRRIAAMAGKTFRRGVLAPVGGFGALFQPDWKGWREPVLVASADGVGTKLKIACATGIHTTVGADIVNHCVNDILTQGARPLFFLDYIAMGKLDVRVVEQVMEGMSRAAKRAGCALIGGETAEMPGLYAPGEYDLAGFIVGAVERKKLLDPRRVRSGDALLGLPSSGLHTNGYSLARKLVFGTAKLGPEQLRGRSGQQDRRGTPEAAPRLLAAGEKYSGAGVGIVDGAYHRRRNHRESAAGAAAEREGGGGAGVVAGAADFSLPCEAGRDGPRGAARDFQSGRGNDPGGSGEARLPCGGGTEAAAREIFSCGARGKCRAREAESGLYGNASAVIGVARVCFAGSRNCANFWRT